MFVTLHKVVFELFRNDFEMEGMFGELSGIVSCDSAAIRIRIRIVRCERPAKRQKHRPWETKARVFPLLFLVGSQESVLKVPERGQYHAAMRVPKVD